MYRKREKIKLESDENSPMGRCGQGEGCLDHCDWVAELTGEDRGHGREEDIPVFTDRERHDKGRLRLSPEELRLPERWRRRVKSGLGQVQ